MGRFAPEEELEAADKGPEIIVPLDLLERVQCKAAKDLESWPGESKKHQVLKLLCTGRMSALILEIFRCGEPQGICEHGCRVAKNPN